MATVLVIDDEQIIRYLLDTLRSRKGYTVVLAESGKKGLELVRRANPDLIILDLKMPEMDGLTVLREIRTHDLQKPVVILTGYKSADAEAQARELGVTEFISKEFSLHLLGDVLKRLLPNSDPPK